MNNKAIRCVNIVVLLAVTAFVLVLAAPIATAAQTSNKTSGQGEVEGGWSYSISVKDKAKGLSGFAQVAAGTTVIARGSVTCYLAVAANYSVIGVEIEEADSDVVGSNKGMLIRVQDNGTTDSIGHLFVAEPPASCITQIFAISEVVHGNFTVDNAVNK
jgi:hypothetical protein